MAKRELCRILAQFPWRTRLKPLSVEEYYSELNRLGLENTHFATVLIGVWTFDGMDFYLPRPEPLNEEDRVEALEIVKKTLGIGLRPHVG